MGRARLVSLVVLLAALVAGCGSTPTPKFAPPPSTAVPGDPSTSSAADPLPPVMPEVAKEHTVAGAKAFVRYYWEVANYAQRHLDPATLASLGDRNCDGCRGAADAIKNVRSKHGSINGGATEATSIQVFKSDAPDGTVWMEVRYAVRTGPQRVDLPGTRNDVDYPGGRGKAHMALKPTAQGWLVDLFELSW